MTQKDYKVKPYKPTMDIQRYKNIPKVQDYKSLTGDYVLNGENCYMMKGSNTKRTNKGQKVDHNDTAPTNKGKKAW